MTNDRDDRRSRLERAVRLKRAAARRPSEPAIPRREPDQPPTLGALQHGLWIEHGLQGHRGSAAYNLASVFRVERGAGSPETDREIDPRRLEMALRAVVRRHRILRSSFVPEKHSQGAVRSAGAAPGVILQQVQTPEQADSSLALQLHEVLPGALEETARRLAREPFEPSRGPLIRLHLVRERRDPGPVAGADDRAREREDHGSADLLVLMLHHLVADERSLAVLWRDLAHAYEAAEHDSNQAPPPERQYDDFVPWYHQRVAETRERDLEYWRRALAGAPQRLRLPYEAKGHAEAVAPDAGALLRRPLEQSVRWAVVQRASEWGTTPFALCAFVYRTLLARLQREPDVVFGTASTRRVHPDLADVVGYFLNPVVLRIAVDENKPVPEAVVQFASELRQALAHGDLPFDQLVAELDPPRTGSTPWFQHFFVYREIEEDVRLAGLRLEPMQLDLGTSKFDSTLFVSLAESAPELAVEFRSALYSAPWMQTLLDQYATLLSAVTEDVPEPHGLRLADLGLVDDAEKRRLAAWGDRRADKPTASAGKLHEESALPVAIWRTLCERERELDLAVVGGEGGDPAHRGWSRRRLRESATHLAIALRARGVESGDRVAIYLPRSPEMVAATLGCLWAGAAYVPLDPSYPSARNLAVLADAGVAAVLSDARGGAQLEDDFERHCEAESSSEGWPVLDVGAVLHEATQENAPLPLDWHPQPTRAESPAYLLYTSGSSGRPKGVVVSHGGLRLSTLARTEVYEGAPERFLLLSSLAFDSSVAGLFWTLLTGGILVLPTHDQMLDARELAGLIERDGVTDTLCVPSLWQEVLRRAAHHPQLQTLRRVIVAGEVCPPTLAEQHQNLLPGVPLYNEYGPTEATVWASVHEVLPGEDPVPIGRPIPGVCLEVRDAVGRPVPTGVVGELVIRGPTVASGYWQQPERTREVFDVAVDAADRTYRSGDLARWTERGVLELQGRFDQQLKVRGFRVEAGEIEARLAAIPEVAAAAVVQRPLASGGGRTVSSNANSGALVGFVVLAEGSAGAQQDVLEAAHSTLRRDLPSYMVPARLVRLDQLPRLPNGKLDRATLRQLPLPSPEVTRQTAQGATEVSVASTTVQRGVARCWQRLLFEAPEPSPSGSSSERTAPEIGLDDNFFELGGHSLLVVEMAERLEREFDVSLRPADLFATPTVREIAEHLEALRRGERAVSTEGLASTDAASTSGDQLFPIQPAGSGVPFVMAIPHHFTAFLAETFRGKRPVYGLRGVGMRPDGNLGRWPTLEALARQGLQEIERQFPEGPLELAGYSFGASLAFELARQFEQGGRSVEHLWLIAPMPLQTLRLGPLRFRFDELERAIEEYSLGQRLRLWLRDHRPWTRRPYRRLRWRLLTQPGRLVQAHWGALRRRRGWSVSEQQLFADVRVERFRLHHGYRPRSLGVPTTILEPREGAMRSGATWCQHFEGPLERVPTPDPHRSPEAQRECEQLLLRLWRAGAA